MFYVYIVYFFSLLFSFFRQPAFDGLCLSGSLPCIHVNTDVSNFTLRQINLCVCVCDVLPPRTRPVILVLRPMTRINITRNRRLLDWRLRSTGPKLLRRTRRRGTFSRSTRRFLSSEVGSRNNFRDWELVDKLAFFEC